MFFFFSLTTHPHFPPQHRPNFPSKWKDASSKGGEVNMKMEPRHRGRWRQRAADGEHGEGQAKDEAHLLFFSFSFFFPLLLSAVGTQWRLHCRSLKSLSNASLSLRGLGRGRVNKGWVYAISALVHFVFLFFFSSTFFPPPQKKHIYIFFCLHQMSS